MSEFAGAAEPEHVQELRLVVTAEDYDTAVTFYRDVVGLPELAAYQAEGGHVTILDAGRATLEITDPVHAAYIDRVEVGRRVAGHIRVAPRGARLGRHERLGRGCEGHRRAHRPPRGVVATPGSAHRPDCSLTLFSMFDRP